MELYVPPQIMGQHGIMEHQEQQRQLYEIAYGDSTFVAVGQSGTHTSIQAITELHGVLEHGLKLDWVTGVAFGNNTFIGVSNVNI